MSRERSYKGNVSFWSSSYQFIVQFEEKKFLETARKIIQTSVANTSQKLEGELYSRIDQKPAK